MIVSRANGYDPTQVSIVMPAYNCAAYIDAAVVSVMEQTYSNWELLIVEDRSSDDTREHIADIVAKYHDDRIRVLLNESNRGAALSRNRAMREARGRWIAFLDGDDLWDRRKLEIQVETMLDRGCAWSYTDYELVAPDGSKRGVVMSAPNRLNRRDMKRYCWPGCLTVMYDAAKLGVLQIPDLKKRNDYAMWLRISRMTSGERIPHVLAQYRSGVENSVSNVRLTKLISSHYLMFRKAESLNPPLAAIATLRNLIWGPYKKNRFRKLG